MTRWAIHILPLLTAFLVWGCSTPYQKQEGISFRGGYSDQLLDNDTARISYSSHSFRASYWVEIYLERRCAEFTLEQGFEYFEVIDRKTIPQTIPCLRTPCRSYSAWAIIKLYKGQRPDRTTVISAKELMNGVRALPKLQRELWITP